MTKKAIAGGTIRTRFNTVREKRMSAGPGTYETVSLFDPQPTKKS